MASFAIRDDERQHILDTAVELFYAQGFHATSVEQVAAKAGVEAATLQNHFGSKDELIVSAMQRRDEHFRSWLQSELAKRPNTPRERLLALFDILREWYDGPGFHGCMFINATVEFSARDNPINQAAACHKQALYDYVHELTAATGAANAADISNQLVLLMEGAIVTTQVTGKSHAAHQARVAAESLITQAGISQDVG